MTDDQQQRRQEQQQSHHRSLIIGGVKAPLRRYPYFVSLSQTQGSEGECGGSLIAPDLFITAGHCLPERTIHKLKHRDDADVAWARVGITAREELNDDYYFQSPNEIEQDFMVLRATRHHKFERLGDDEFRYDYAIVQLKGQSNLTYISLLRDESLLDPTKHPYLRALGLGWTYVDRPSRANWLHYVDLTWINNTVCEDAFNHYYRDDHNKRIDKSQLCTFEKGKDSCAYDSGGPLILWADNTTYNKDWLVGQVSWGIGCANEYLPGVNSRISTVLDWIDDVVCSWSKNPPPDFNCPQTNITTPADTTDISGINDTTTPTKRRFRFNNGGDGSKTTNNNNKNETITLPWLGRADYVLLPAYIISVLLVWKRRRQFYQTIK